MTRPLRKLESEVAHIPPFLHGLLFVKLNSSWDDLDYPKVLRFSWRVVPCLCSAMASGSPSVRTGM